MTDAKQVADEIEGEEEQPTQETEGQDTEQMSAPGKPEVDEELVSAIHDRIKEVMPTVQQMGQFEQSLQQNPDLAKILVQICPEMIIAFVSCAQEAQGQQTGMATPGGADGAEAPPVSADADPQMPPPAATSTGSPPPSMPSQDSPLRKQFYTGR